MLSMGLLALLLSGVVIISWCGIKWLRVACAIVWDFLFCLQLSSVYLGNSFVDYKFFRHISPETFAMASAFKVEIGLFVLVALGLPFLLLYAGQWLRSRLVSSGKGMAAGIRTAVIALMLCVLTLPRESMYRKLSEIFTIVTTDVRTDNALLAQLTPKEQLQVTAPSPKNVVIISLESFEKAFLLPPNDRLTPYLQDRIKSWQLYDMTPTSGTGFTIASLYTALTGLPSYFAGNGNNYFKGATSSRLISLADILDKAGYDTYHLSNNARFAGTRNLLKALGVHHVCDINTFAGRPEKAPMSGAYDKDIFTEAKAIAREKRNHPFMMFIATTQTHGPNGFVDPRMLDVVTPGETTLETATLSTDWLLEDFLQSLEREGILDNTVVYIMPDHSFWGEKPLLDRTGTRHALWMLTNADSLSIDRSNFHQLDLPKVILQGAGVGHNARFLTDIIGTENKNHFIEQHLKEITALNTSQLSRTNILDESLRVQQQQNNVYCYIDNALIYKGKTRKLQGKHIIIPFDETLKYMPARVYTDRELADEFYELCDTYIDIRYDGQLFGLTWVRDNVQQYSMPPAEAIRLESEDIYTILKQITAEGGLLNAVEAVARQRLLTPDSTYFRGCVLDYLPRVMSDSDKLLLITAFDDASVQFDSIEPLLHSFGLRETLSGKFRHAYIAALSHDSVYVEKAAYSVLHRKVNIDGNAISLTSTGLDHSNKHTISRILVNGREYALPRRGLNFVIVDRSDRQVVDAFHVDTYGDPDLTVRR